MKTYLIAYLPYSESGQWWHPCKLTNNRVLDWYLTLICLPYNKKWYWPQGIQKDKSAENSTCHVSKETDVLSKFVANLHAYQSCENPVWRKKFPLAASLNHPNDRVYTNTSKKRILNRIVFFDKEIATTNILWSLDSFRRLEMGSYSL